jgi:hypothetical protein
MKNLLRKLFRMKPAEPTPRKDARTFKVGGGWGDAITWFDFKTGRVSGHKTPKPKVGDVLTSQMQSGKIGVFLFASVEPCGDPPDMFFGTVTPVGYADELRWPLPPEQSGDPLGGLLAKDPNDYRRVSF